VYRLANHDGAYHVTEGDGGLAYSYSVYDSFELLSEWVDRTFVVPTVPAEATWLHPLFAARNVLPCASRDA
jgi:hypothetical protein